MPEFLWTAVSRSGVYGPFDIPYNILYGMRFERNLTSVSSGAGVAYTLSHIQNVLKAVPGLGCNSPNTNKAEHTAVKSAYLLTVGPFLSALLSVTPTVPTLAAPRAGAIQYGSSASAASKFADMVVGDRDE
jgi:hypothetical protein